MADKKNNKPNGGAKGGAKSMNHGVKNPNKVANKYDGFGMKKGKK
tara:strand:- start:447 stop:581 length:135 start_codon:yes stop_codon:yes gene_type:complete